MTFWNQFIEISPQNFAIHRFHTADFEPYAPDRFVNYVQSMESLLVPDSGDGEIGYKLRIRGAIFLGNGKSTEVFETLRQAYTLRSKIVHGDRKRVDKIIGDNSGRWENLIKPVRCLAREAIKHFFRHACLDDSEKGRKRIQKIEKGVGLLPPDPESKAGL